MKAINTRRPCTLSNLTLSPSHYYTCGHWVILTNLEINYILTVLSYRVLIYAVWLLTNLTTTTTLKFLATLHHTHSPLLHCFKTTIILGNPMGFSFSSYHLLTCQFNSYPIPTFSATKPNIRDKLTPLHLKYTPIDNSTP